MGVKGGCLAGGMCFFALVRRFFAAWYRGEAAPEALHVIHPPFSFRGKKTGGARPKERLFTLAVSILKSCTRCAIGCGVHGFAMNPYVSLRLATAPYYREARVTFVWRQTACRMRHCCARRIVGCLDRRKLGCTCARWAERQRTIGVGQVV